MQEKHPIQPEYIRLPAHGAIEPYSGLNRTALERLVIPKPENNFEPPVQSKLFNPSGGKRWVRLIIYRSLLAHLAKLPSGQVYTPYPSGAAARPPKVTTPRRRRRVRKESVEA